ncbi:ankyrin repeat domain-containing protein [Cardinium endosymbiont of Nabis limbatus]|uniref:ankyrin repeat domain-containing protein n=1 Tax=Cardinium endosymbiont of Nabis limbatus TaxID=3066217 RepID=UPI003AF36692
MMRLWSTLQPSSTTTAQPDDGVPPVKDSMVIDDEIMEYLDANNFSKKSMQELFEKGLNKDAKEVTNSTLLMKVAVRPDKDEARVKFLIDQGVDVNQQDERGDTVLHMLSRRGWEHIIKLFPGVKDKINPNLQDTYKRTVLHEAIIHGCFKNTAEWLLQIKGIDINIKDKDGKTPLDLAKEKDEGDCDIIQELLNNYNRH